MTSHFDESIMIGTREMSGSLAISLRKRSIAAFESSIASSMLMSITCAPFSTCWRATASASSKRPSRIIRAKAREPVTLVRSPTLTNSESLPTLKGSRPDRRSFRSQAAGGARLDAGNALGDRRDVFGRGAAAAADDVHEALASPSRRFPRPVAPAFRRSRQKRSAGRHSGAPRRSNRKIRDNSSTYWRSSAAPSAQLRPKLSGRTWFSEFQKASAVCPESVRPEASVIVPEIITGQRRPTCLEVLLDGKQRRLGVQRVENGLDQDQVGAAFAEPATASA
jgi:hypothetical protein